MFPDELRVSSFPDRVPTLCLDSGIVSPPRLRWVKGVYVKRSGELPSTSPSSSSSLPAKFGPAAPFVNRETFRDRQPDKYNATWVLPSVPQIEGISVGSILLRTGVTSSEFIYLLFTHNMPVITDEGSKPEILSRIAQTTEALTGLPRCD